jgi:Arc/MetJ-type ribon-helix-helix transcriptional regulator
MAEKMVKLSVSVGSDVVEWIDKEIEKRVYRNRSHALDVAAHLLMEREHD